MNEGFPILLPEYLTAPYEADGSLFPGQPSLTGMIVSPLSLILYHLHADSIHTMKGQFAAAPGQLWLSGA